MYSSNNRYFVSSYGRHFNYESESFLPLQLILKMQLSINTAHLIPYSNLKLPHFIFCKASHLIKRFSAS